MVVNMYLLRLITSLLLASCSAVAFLPSIPLGAVSTALRNNISYKELGCRSSSILRSSVSPATKASLSSSSPPSPRDLVREGMDYFRQADIPSSLAYFDLADSLSNTQQKGGGGAARLAPYLWQRGISYYYLNKFDSGHEQFKLDVSVNPNDVEEIVWDIACLARMHGNHETTVKTVFPPKGSMTLPPGQKDSRRIMSTVYSLFRNEEGTTEYDLRKAGHESNNPSDEFYSLFYLGLYCEVRNELSKAEAYMRAAATSKYATTGIGSGDYMSACAKVHCRLRSWDV